MNNPENNLVVDNAAPAGMDEFSFDQIPVDDPQVPAGDFTPAQEAIVEPTGEGVKPPAKEDDTRFEYWQSQADKAKSELSALRQEVDYYRNLEAQAGFSNGNLQAYPEQGLQDDSLKEPVAPEKPVNYNEIDAYSDSDSESFKYRMAKEQYRDEYMKFLMEKDARREQDMQEQYAYEMAVQRDNMMRSQAHSHAVNSYGWEPTKANEFVQWATNPDNLTIDNLAKLFELRSNTSPVVQQRTQQMQNQAQLAQVPRPAAIQPGQVEQPRTEEQMFSDALLGR